MTAECKEPISAGAKAALRQLELLGKDPARTWFRTIRHGKGANSRRKGADLQGFDADALRADAAERESLYFLVGEARAASGTKKVKDPAIGEVSVQPTGAVIDADVEAMPALFVEWDDGDLADQLTAWQQLSLPEPTLMLTTGGKSAHVYWRLRQPAPTDVWKQATARLIAHCQSDGACSNPARVMRLAGSAYVDRRTGKPTGARAEIVHEAPQAVYDLAKVLACLPEPAAAPAPPAAQPARTGGLPPRSLQQVLDALQWIPPRIPGQGHYRDRDRPAALGFVHAVVEAGGSVEQALARLEAHHPQWPDLAQVVRSSNLSEWTAGSFWHHVRENGGDTSRPELRSHHRPQSAAAAPVGDGAQGLQPPTYPRRELTPQEKLAAMRSLAGELLERQAPFPDRLPLLRARAEALNLTLRDQELQRLLWDARRAAAGTIEPLGTGEVIDLSPCPWHWESVLMADCLNLIAGLPKTGKTALLLALIGAWSRGEPSFLGLSLIGPCPPVLIVGTDQPASDWGRMMREVGLLGDKNEILAPIVALFHKGRPLHLDFEGIERIGTYAAQNPRLLILLDSISACTSALGLDENSAEIVEPINDLMEAVSPHGVTVLAIHHSSKGKQGESATLASRGSTALPAAASQVIALARMASSLAGPPDRRLVLKTEGRGGMPQQLLIERTEAGWISHGSAEAVAQAAALQEVENRLSDRQAEALDVVRERWSSGQQRTDARSLVGPLGLEGDGERKARATLDQLVRHGLLHFAFEAGLQGRIKWFWPVGAEASRGVLSNASEPSYPSYPHSLARTCLDPDFSDDPFPDKGSEGKEGKEGPESTPREPLLAPDPPPAPRSELEATATRSTLTGKVKAEDMLIADRLRNLKRSTMEAA